MKNQLSINFILILCLAQAGATGQISPDLQSKVRASKNDEMIRVWIKLPRAESADQLRLEVESASNTREGRYFEAYDRLKSTHQNKQMPLRSILEQKKSAGKCRNFKCSWLANVIEAEITAGELEALAQRNDVEVISTIPVLTSIGKSGRTQTAGNALSTAGVEPNLTFIRAPQAWALGYTGAGRIICSFDTGIDGDHPALYNSWKGHDGDSAAAWFDPSQGSSFPNPVLDVHGTQVMGIMVGHDDVTGDTIGVAPDAKWISVAVVDIEGASYIDAFEWAANPDGDFNTVSDVPDVINHSWGIEGIGCQDFFFEFIDNLEALGVVNIFACGNDGPTASTIRNPANRALDSIDCFSVGAVTVENPPAVLSYSSRGPSNCSASIKPNVCAPGTNIRTAYIGDIYDFADGTSIAAPHVSGLVALLRQKNPNATVSQIKNAILTTTQFRPNPVNNNIGWGVINCSAALTALSTANSSPNVRVFEFDHNPILPGTSVGGKVVLQNLGSNVTALTGAIIGSNPAIGIVDGTCSFGAMVTNDTAMAADSIRVNIVDSVSVGTVLSMNFRITNNTTFTDTVKLYFLVEPPTQRSFVTHDAGLIDFSVSSYGTYGLGQGSFFPTGGAGFEVDSSGQNDLYECGLMIGYDSLHISDGVRNAISEPDGDFLVKPGGNIAINLPGTGGAQKTKARYNDSRAENPIGIDIKQFTYTFTNAAYDDFVIMRFLITNTNAFFVGDLYAGLYLDWDIPIYSLNAGGYDATGQVSWTAFFNGGVYSNYRGSVVLDGTPAGSFTAPASTTVYYPQGFTEREKDSALGSGFSSGATYNNSQLDLVQVISAGPMDLSAGATATVTFALLAGNTLNDLRTAATAANLINDTLINTCCNGIRGNINGDGVNGNIVDLNYLVNRIFRGGPLVPCPQEADVNGDSNVASIFDLNYLINFIFRGGLDPIACPGY
ncbi:MAG TPA: S8 family serine peptidase [candidate division Zixibacteria bacterium]|nr:S8 family serine peptidase [candidate division Zixibacteria bacterium]